MKSLPRQHTKKNMIPHKGLAIKRINLRYFAIDVGRMDTLRESGRVKKIYSKSTSASLN